MLDDRQAGALTAAAIEDAQTDCALGDRTSLQFMRAMYQARTLEEEAWHLYQRVYARESAAHTRGARPADGGEHLRVCTIQTTRADSLPAAKA